MRSSFVITNDISLRCPCKADFEEVARRMRPADRAELRVTHGNTSARLLKMFARKSAACFTLCARGRPVALFGLTPDALLGRRACVWLITARGVERFPVGFVKAARLAVRYFLTLYPELYNYVDRRYAAAARFARALGARAEGSPVYAGRPAVAFELFIFRRNTYGRSR